jgi:hypothetical protein
LIFPDIAVFSRIEWSQILAAPPWHLGASDLRMASLKLPIPEGYIFGQTEEEAAVNVREEDYSERVIVPFYLHC